MTVPSQNFSNLVGSQGDLSKKRIKDAMKKNQTILDNALAVTKQNAKEASIELGEPEINITSYASTKVLKSPVSSSELLY